MDTSIPIPTFPSQPVQISSDTYRLDEGFEKGKWLIYDC